ncbi:MAG: glycosyltransferase [Lentisphaeraceae bacterium]|nr:glycosyltransferase [Lentisphaeraceae bacterium]
MLEPQISIIFPTYNRPEEVIFNLEFFRQNISVPYEVFILDNSPTQMNYDFNSNEHYTFLNENIGTSSRNLGMQNANSPICLLLDDDSHPETGEVERIIEKLELLDDSEAGLICEIHNPDGNREASLLPTVFHGAGVVFKTSMIQKHNLAYPENFCFYGEEYRLTLDIYAAGLSLKNSDIKIIHRRSSKGRDLKKIFYYLGRNNKTIWQDIVPTSIEENIINESKARYDLTAAKECVSHAFEEGLNDEITSDLNMNRMTTFNFGRFALIDKFKQLENDKTYILCGTGKFPSTWATILKEKSCTVYVTDFNKAFHQKPFLDLDILTPEKALELTGTYIIGHSSLCDTLKWQDYLSQNSKNNFNLNDLIHERQFI